MEDNIQEIKDFLIQKAHELQSEIDDIVSGIEHGELTTFETQLFSDYKYYENKYVNEETFRQSIEKLFGSFPLEYIFSEVNDFFRKKIYLNALQKYIRDLDD